MELVVAWTLLRDKDMCVWLYLYPTIMIVSILIKRVHVLVYLLCSILISSKTKTFNMNRIPVLAAGDSDYTQRIIHRIRAVQKEFMHMLTMVLLDRNLFVVMWAAVFVIIHLSFFSLTIIKWNGKTWHQYSIIDFSDCFYTSWIYCNGIST